MITCYFENGNKDGLRHLVTSAIIIKGSEILLGKRGTFQGKPILESGKWSLIGGFLDRDETLIQGVTREVKEETGYVITNVRPFYIVDNPNRRNDVDRQNVKFTFLADIGSEDIIKNEETTELKWFDINELPLDSEIAFDFADDLNLYKRYLKEKFPIPVLG